MEIDMKKLLDQYESLQQELRDKRASIDKLQVQISKMNVVRDSVTGGNGGTQHFIVEGFPYPEYSRKMSMLLMRKAVAKDMETKLEIMLIEVERGINDIKDSRIRRMIEYRYIEKLAWHQVAQRMGKHHTEDSCKKAIERYFK